jgi:hypothetical protein
MKKASFSNSIQRKINKLNGVCAKRPAPSRKVTTTEMVNGREVVRINRDATKKESMDAFEDAVKDGKMVCLSDLMINYGM